MRFSRLSKTRRRLLAAVILLAGAAVFASGQPRRLPEEQVAAAKAAYEEWSQRQRADILVGRRSSAGAAPVVEVHTKGSLPLVLLGFAIMGAAIAVFITSLKDN
jgi:hypothetical protein